MLFDLDSSAAVGSGTDLRMLSRPQDRHWAQCIPRLVSRGLEAVRRQMRACREDGRATFGGKGHGEGPLQGAGRPAWWRRPGPPGLKSRLPKNYLQSYLQTFGYPNKTL